MPISRRYSPEWAPGEATPIGADFSPLVPPGVGLVSGALTIWHNVVPPVEVTDFAIGPVSVSGRALYTTISGGTEGRDYQLRWVAHDTEGNVWPRTALLLCAQTS
jgi:hypothetical protein